MCIFIYLYLFIYIYLQLKCLSRREYRQRVQSTISKTEFRNHPPRDTYWNSIFLTLFSSIVLFFFLNAQALDFHFKIFQFEMSKTQMLVSCCSCGWKSVDGIDRMRSALMPFSLMKKDYYSILFEQHQFNLILKYSSNTTFFSCQGTIKSINKSKSIRDQ